MRPWRTAGVKGMFEDAENCVWSTCSSCLAGAPQGLWFTCWLSEQGKSHLNQLGNYSCQIGNYFIRIYIFPCYTSIIAWVTSDLRALCNSWFRSSKKKMLSLFIYWQDFQADRPTAESKQEERLQQPQRNVPGARLQPANVYLGVPSMWNLFDASSLKGYSLYVLGRAAC